MNRGGGCAVAIASWTAAVHCRFLRLLTPSKSARGLAHSITWRPFGCFLKSLFSFSAGVGTMNGAGRCAVAIASWTAAVLCRFLRLPTPSKSARGLAHSKTWRLSGGFTVASSAGSRSSMLMLVCLNITAGFKEGEQVKNLVFGQCIQQSEGHQRGLLRLPFLDIGFLERLEERGGRAGLNGHRVGIFLDDHAQHFVSILQLELIIAVALVYFERRVEDLVEHVGAAVVVPFENIGQVRAVFVSFVAQLVALGAGQTGKKFLADGWIPTGTRLCQIRHQVFQFPFGHLLFGVAGEISIHLLDHRERADHAAPDR